MTTTNRNVHFWVWSNGLVKITLAPGESLECGFSEPTEEGYHGEWSRWDYDGETVTREWSTSDRDCDGRFSAYGVETWDCATTEPAYSDPSVPMPVWASEQSGQRDYSAEAMGY